MDLASQIGANPAKALSRSNVSFLGKGPVKNPLFQRPLPGLENATTANLGKPETLFKAVEDAVGWAKDGKLNSIQTEILGQNLVGIRNIVKPPPAPVLPSAQMLQFPKRGSGITSMIDEMPITRTTPLTAEELAKLRAVKPLREPKNLPPRSEMETPLRSQLPEAGPGDIEAMNRALNAKTGMSRAIARQILQQDTRLTLKPEELYSLKKGYFITHPEDYKDVKIERGNVTYYG